MKELYEELKKKYRVNHLMNEHKQLIFILESPHIDELLNAAPVSGLSGKAMSSVLFGKEEKTPLGIKTKAEPESTIGIMNICPVPMQRTAYIHPEVVNMYGEFDMEKYESFFNVLEKLRTGTKQTYKEQTKNDLQTIILNDFKTELMKLKDQEVVLIPCGNTAQTFFDVAEIEHENWTVLRDVPHPSFGNI